MNDNRKRIASAAAIVASLYMVSRVLGLVRQMIFGAYFGTVTNPAEAYAMVAPVTDLIFNVIAGGALGSAFIPVFSGYFVDDDDETAGWQLFSTVVTLVLIASTLVSLIVALFAPQLLSLLYEDRLDGNAELIRQTVLLLRIWLVSTVIFGASGVVMVALNARQHFLYPAVATIVYNIGIIVGILLFPNSVIGVGIGAAVGALGHLLIQLPALRGVGGSYQPLIQMTANVREIGRLMLPRVVGLSFSQFSLIVMQRLVGGLEPGSGPALLVGARVMLLPQSVLGQALGVASFPTFSILAAKRDFVGMRQILADTLRFILFLGLPIAAGMMLVRRPLIQLAFQRGNFEERDTVLVAFALLFYALALVALSLIEVLVRAFYAMKDTWTPVIAGVVQMVLFFGGGWWLGQSLFPANGWLGLGGVALAFTVANWIEVIMLLFLLQRKMGGIGAADILNGAVRMSLATAGMAAGVWLGIQMMTDLQGLGGLLVQLGASSVIGLIIYSALCYIFNVREVRQIGGIVLTQVRRRR